MQVNITWDEVLHEHWRQFKLACQSMNRGEKMPELEWREYVLYDLCKKHKEFANEKRKKQALLT
jgi:hypothetical protein